MPTIKHRLRGRVLFQPVAAFDVTDNANPEPQNDPPGASGAVPIRSRPIWILGWCRRAIALAGCWKARPG